MAAHRLLKNTLSLTSVQAVAYLLPLLTLPYLARVLGPDGLGTIAAAMALSLLMSLWVDFGFDLSASRDVSLCRDDPQRVADIYCAVSAIRLCLLLSGMVLLGVLVWLVPSFSGHALLYFACYLLPVGSVLLPRWLFQGLEQFHGVSLIQIGSRIMLTAAIFMLVRTREDLITAALLQSCTTTVAGLLCIPLTRRALRGGRLQLPAWQALRLHARRAWPLFISTAAVSAYTSANTLLVGLASTPEQAGLFHVAERIIGAVQGLCGPITQAVYPHANNLGRTAPAELLRFNRKLMLGLIATTTAAAILLIVFGNTLITMLFGHAYTGAASALLILALSPLLTSTSNVLGVQTMLPLGLQSEFGRILPAAAALNLIVLMPMAAHHGAIGAAGTVLLVEGFVVVAMLMILYRNGITPALRRVEEK